MFDWINNHYKVVAAICVPIVVAIIGLFKKGASEKKKEAVINGDKNTTAQADGGIGMLVTQNGSPNATQNFVQGNQIMNFCDLNSLEIMAKGFITTMYPTTEKALNTLRLNAFGFLGLLEKEFKKLSNDEREKFSEPDVQIALQTAIKGASIKNTTDIHETLARLLMDRVQKPRCSIAKLAIDESIGIVSKLDENLIKILSLSFLFSRTKHVNIQNKKALFEVLSRIASEFDDINVTTSKFEYLEAISCGKFIQLISNDLIDIIFSNYFYLFLKNISIEEVGKLMLPDQIKQVCFESATEGFLKFKSILGPHLFDGQMLYLTNGSPVIISVDEEVRQKLRATLVNNRLSKQEIAVIFSEECAGFNRIVEVWNTSGFASFSLTAVGIAIGRAYLEKSGFGDYDINIWIN